MELEDVKKKIKTGELTLSKFGGKSEVWNHFKQIMGSDNNVSAWSSALSVALVALYIKIILNIFPWFKQHGIVAENVIYNSPRIKK